MTVCLKEKFPMIRDREEVRKELEKRDDLREIFDSWEEDQQERFLECCTGMRGVKILRDPFFKLIFDPNRSPERLERVLSLLLQEEVKILQILPNESTRIAAERSLLVMDIVVEMHDGSIANVEVQRIGYAFPGQRSACYSSDLLMRQYKRVKAKRKKKFRYSDIKKVYTIVFFETSTGEFHKFPEDYIHHSMQRTDTGLHIELLQEYIFISLDIFRENIHNKGIDTDNRLEAWLTFLSEDDPKWILRLLEEHPEFEELYKEVYEACRNMEDFMGLFSEELLELDRNTVDFMIDEMQRELDEQKVQLNEKDMQLSEQKAQLDEKDAVIAELMAQLQR